MFATTIPQHVAKGNRVVETPPLTSLPVDNTPERVETPPPPPSSPPPLPPISDDETNEPPPLPPPPLPEKPFIRSSVNHNINSEVREKKEKRLKTPAMGRPPRWGSRDVSVFDIIEQVGEGTYGEVYKAQCKTTGEIVALKKIRMDQEVQGFPITAIREIKILKSLSHENIVLLKEIVTSETIKGDKGRASVYLVFEYLDHDLAGLLDTERARISRMHIKCYMKQLLEGVAYMHKNKILHRDIKASNLLLDNQGHLKIGDWGLARSWNENKIGYTNKVITLWYRPPELLLGEVNYGPAIDMWSVGCIFAELLFGSPILPGRDEMHQLQLIFHLCGTPTEKTWPGYAKLPMTDKFSHRQDQKSILREKFKAMAPEALELIEQLLTLDPSKRISANQALDSKYFWQCGPPVCKPHELPKFKAASIHEYQAKLRRHQAKEHSQKRTKAHHYKPYHRNRDEKYRKSR